MRCSSHRRGEALAGAPLDNAPKEYPPKIQQLVQDIASLTLLEISDLNELLKVPQAGPGTKCWGPCLVSCSGTFGEFRKLWKVRSLGAGTVPEVSLSVSEYDSLLLKLFSSVPAENVEDPGCWTHADGRHDA